MNKGTVLGIHLINIYSFTLFWERGPHRLRDVVSVLVSKAEKIVADCMQRDECHANPEHHLLVDLRGGLPGTVGGETRGQRNVVHA